MKKSIERIIGKTVLTKDLSIGQVKEVKYNQRVKGYQILINEKSIWYPEKNISTVNYKITAEITRAVALLKIILEKDKFTISSQDITKSLEAFRHMYFCQNYELIKTLKALDKEKVFLGSIRLAFWISAVINLVLIAILLPLAAKLFFNT